MATGCSKRRPCSKIEGKSMTLSAASSDDAAAVISLCHLCELTRPWNDPQADFERALACNQATIFVLRDGDAIIGSVMVGDDGHRGWVYYLAVDPSHQGNGMGRALMDAAECWLKARGCPKIQFMVRSTNQAARGFYDRLGYAPQDVVTLGRFLND